MTTTNNEHPSSMKILIVDDSFIDRALIKMCLAPCEHFTFIQAEDGLQALQLLQDSQFDLLITDYEMPRLNGLELIGELKQLPESNTLPVIMLSASVDYKLKDLALDSGVDLFHRKPIDPSSFLQAVTALIL